MVYYYCEICNNNIDLRKGKNLRCKQCGYFLITPKLNLEEILRRKERLTTYCSHCDKKVSSIPIKIMITAITQRTAWEIENLKSKKSLKPRQHLSKEEKDSVVKTISTKLNSALSYLYQTERRFQYICSDCFIGVDLFSQALSNLQGDFKSEDINTLLCLFCNKKIDYDSIYCKYCGAKINGKTRHIQKNVKEKVWERDSGCCVECRSKEDLQYHHIIPYSLGGANSVANLQILCSSCNKKKTNKIGG